MRCPLLFAIVLPLRALAQEPAPPVAPATPASLEPAVPQAPVEPAPSASPPQSGGAIEADGWRVVAFSGSHKWLPDGRPTADLCGWERDVVVEPIADAAQPRTGADVRRAVLSVPCAQNDSGALVAGQPSLRLVEAARDRPISDDDVHRVIERNTKAIAACQQRDPAVSGELQVTWLVGASGLAENIVVVGGAVPSPGISDCVMAEIKTWRFPPHSVQGGIPVDVAFGFAGNEGPVAGGPGAATCKADEKPKAEKDLSFGEVACVEVKAHPCAQGEKPLAQEQLAPGQLSCIEVASERGVPFLKGELTRFGDVELTNTKTSFGLGLGITSIDGVYFAQLRPDLNLYLGPVALGLGAPLRFELADLSAIDVTNLQGARGDVLANTGRFRTQDWDEPEDFLRPIRSLTYGRKEDRLYVDIGRVHSVTLGHGQLVRRYTPNVDIDEDRLLAAVDGYTDIGGVELLAGPFPVPRMVGGLLFIKPLGAFFDDVMAKSWSIGATYVTDLNAPTTLDSRLNPADQRLQLAVDATNELLWPGSDNAIGDIVQGVGIDTELKVLKIESLDVKLYADYSHLFFPGDSAQGFTPFDGGGFTLGGLLRANFGKTPVRDIDDEIDEVKAGRAPREMKAAHAVRLRLEGRTFDAKYLPSYFNTSYETDRLQYGITDRALRATLPTKVGFLSARAAEPWRLGYYTELSYAWVDVVGVTAVYEDATVLGSTGAPAGSRNFAVHAETSGLGYLQLFASYHYRNFESFEDIFSFNTDNEILYAGGRIKLMPFLYINAAAQRSFRVGFDDDDLAQPANDQDLRFSSVGFENVWSGTFDVELGWQF